MDTRNKPVLQKIIEALSPEIDDAPYALDLLENHFQHRLLADAGNVTLVGTFSEQLRLQFTTDECSMVLDGIASRRMVEINLEMVEEVINDLFNNGSLSLDGEKREACRNGGPSF